MGKTQTFKLINRLIGKNKNEHQNLKLSTEEAEVSESKEVSEVFSKHFASVANSIFLKIQNTQNPEFGRSVDSSMFLTEANLTEVRGEIERLKLSASHGVDLISDKLLKTFAAIFAPFITDLINHSFDNQEYPIDFKKAIVIPHHNQT